MGKDKRRVVSLLLCCLLPVTVVSGALCPSLFGCGFHGKVGYAFAFLCLVHASFHASELIRYARDEFLD